MMWSLSGMNKIGLDETIEFFISLLKKGASAIIITRDIEAIES